VDLRSDVFLPILMSRGVPADGFLDATLQWCQNGSQLRLEEVGTEAHSRYRPVGEPEAPIQKFRPKDLVVGGWYEAKISGCCVPHIYVGRVKKMASTFEASPKKRFAWLMLPTHVGNFAEFRDWWSSCGARVTNPVAVLRVTSSVIAVSSKNINTGFTHLNLEPWVHWEDGQGYQLDRTRYIWP